MLELKIGTSWVRGVVGDALTPEIVVDFARAFGTWCGGEPVVIGRDPRSSSTMFRSAVVSGLLSTGSDVIDLGLAPTPVVSFVTRELGAAGGLSITGGHNDARWNALKFIGSDGTLLSPTKSQELLDIYHASWFIAAVPGTLGYPDDARVATNRYLEHLLSALDVDPIRERRLSVAIDFCNGSSAPFVTRCLEALGCECVPLNETPSSDFAHPPAPNIANMRELATMMRAGVADLGAAIGVDGDRIAFVTKDGTPLSEEYTLPLAAESRLARRPGRVVTNLSTSRMVEDVARRFGQEVVRTSVGEGYVIDRGLEEGAVLAGEGSGGVGSLPATMAFDGLLTLGMILEHLAVSGSPPAEIARGLPQYAMRKGELPCPPDQAYRVLEHVRQHYADRVPDLTDGVRIEWDDAWLHVRSSNTEPLLRIILEGRDDTRADELFEEATRLGRELLQ